MERIYVVPMRDVKKAPKGKRAPKAVRFIRSFVEKHTKSDAVSIETSLNEKLWEKGIENIPSKIRIKATTQEDGSVLVTTA